MWYLKSAFDAYQKVQDAVQNRLTEVQSAILSPVDMMKRFLGAAATGPEVEAQAGPEPEPNLDALRKRVSELEGRLKRKQGKSRKR